MSTQLALNTERIQFYLFFFFPSSFLLSFNLISFARLVSLTLLLLFLSFSSSVLLKTPYLQAASQSQNFFFFFFFYTLQKNQLDLQLRLPVGVAENVTKKKIKKQMRLSHEKHAFN